MLRPIRLSVAESSRALVAIRLSHSQRETFSLLALGASLRVTFGVAALIGVIAPLLLFFRLRDGDQLVERSGPVDAPKADGSPKA